MLKLVEFSGALEDCECCGCFSARGTSIFFNDVLIWEKYTDGHMGGHKTEEPLVNCVLKAWNEQTLKMIDEQFTESARHEWNEKHKGNVIASTPEYWEEEKSQRQKMFKDDYEEVVKMCEVLPYNEYLQLKMIAIWIEELACDTIEVEKEFVKEK